jgi:hypothetical protein
MSGDPAAVTPHPHLVILNASTMAYVGSWLDNGVYGEAIASPALGRDQKIYLCTHFLSGTSPNDERSGHVYAIDVSVPSAPSKLWEYPAGCMGAVIASPIIGADGRVYVSTQNGRMTGIDHPPALICFDPASATPQVPLWNCTTGGERSLDATPAVDGNGEIYISNDKNGAVAATSASAMNPFQQTDGNDYIADWDFLPSASAKFDSSPVVSADGTIFAKTLDDDPPHAATLYNFNNGSGIDSAPIGKDTIAWHADPVNGGMSAILSSPAIALNGNIYVATAGADNNASPPAPTGGGAIYCFATGTSSQGFWPNFRGNVYNTGNVQDNKWTTNSAFAVSITTLLAGYNATCQAFAVNKFGDSRRISHIRDSDEHLLSPLLLGHRSESKRQQPVEHATDQLVKPKRSFRNQ